MQVFVGDELVGELQNVKDTDAFEIPVLRVHGVDSRLNVDLAEMRDILWLPTRERDFKCRDEGFRGSKAETEKRFRADHHIPSYARCTYYIDPSRAYQHFDFRWRVIQVTVAQLDTFFDSPHYRPI